MENLALQTEPSLWEGSSARCMTPARLCSRGGSSTGHPAPPATAPSPPIAAFLCRLFLPPLPNPTTPLPVPFGSRHLAGLPRDSWEMRSAQTAQCMSHPHGAPAHGLVQGSAAKGRGQEELKGLNPSGSGGAWAQLITRIKAPDTINKSCWHLRRW